MTGSPIPRCEVHRSSHHTTPPYLRICGRCSSRVPATDISGPFELRLASELVQRTHREIQLHGRVVIMRRYPYCRFRTLRIHIQHSVLAERRAHVDRFLAQSHDDVARIMSGDFRRYDTTLLTTPIEYAHVIQLAEFVA